MSGKFTIRDVLWLTTAVACALGGYCWQASKIKELTNTNKSLEKEYASAQKQIEELRVELYLQTQLAQARLSVLEWLSHEQARHGLSVRMDQE